MKILMVCLGNICRSPLAEGILQSKVEKEGLVVFIDSAGTSDNHVGQQPDSRMRATSKSFGVDIDNLRARQFTKSDFKNFDIIYAMDVSNYKNILLLADSDVDKSKVMLLLNELEPGKNLEVPDPYFGGEQGFIDVFNLLDEATDQVIKKIKSNG